MNRRLTATMVAIVLFASLAACGDDDDGAVPTTTTTTLPLAEPTAISVEAREFSFVAPAEVKGGLVALTFKNSGKLKHEATLLSIGDKPPDQALAEFDAADPPAGFPAGIGYGGGAAPTPAGTTAATTFQVKEGNYLFICGLGDSDSKEGAPPDTDEPAHYERGMKASIRVTAAQASALPATEGTIVAEEDTARRYSFDVPPLTAGRHELSFRNDGPQQFHHAQMLEFPAGVDEAAAQEAFRAVSGAVAAGEPPPPGTPLPRDVPGTGVAFAPRFGGTFTVDLKAGQVYMIACFIQDRQGGPPHVIGQNMMKFVTVR